LLSPSLELIGRHVRMNSHVAFGGAHVLAKGHYIDVVFPKL
jgi:hypothetical protein